MVAPSLGHGMRGPDFHAAGSAQAYITAHMERAATSVYVATLGLFDLLRPVAPTA